jgi:hypothetical protein
MLITKPFARPAPTTHATYNAIGLLGSSSSTSSRVAASSASLSPAAPVSASGRVKRLLGDAHVCTLGKCTCRANCLDSVPPAEIKAARMPLLGLSHTERPEWLVAWLRANRVPQKHGAGIHRYHINNRDVCRSSWLHYYGKSPPPLPSAITFSHPSSCVIPAWWFR